MSGPQGPVDRERGAYTPADLSGTVPAVVITCKACNHNLWNGFEEAAVEGETRRVPKKKVRR